MKAIKEKKYMNSLESNTVLNIYTSNERWLFNDANANSSTNLVISTKVSYSMSTERQVAVIGKNESRELSENMEEEKEIMILSLKKMLKNLKHQTNAMKRTYNYSQMISLK